MKTSAYEAPRVETVDSADLLAQLGPAQANLYGVPGDDDEWHDDDEHH
jgi:hypothetical protein